MNERSEENMSNTDKKSLSLLLLLGILFFPFIFSWVTLRSGYSILVRFLAFWWIYPLLILSLVFPGTPPKTGSSTISENSPQEIKTTKEEESATPEINSEQDIYCETESYCFTNWGAWISATEESKFFEGTVETFQRERKLHIAASNYLSSPNYLMTREILSEGERVLRENEGKFYCETRDKSTKKTGIYTFKRTDTYDTKKSMCYGGVKTRTKIPVTINCVYYSFTDECFAQWVKEPNTEMETLSRYKIDLSNNERKKYFNGDVVTLKGEMTTINEIDNEFIKIDNIKSINLESRMGSIFVVCDLGCSIEQSQPFSNHGESKTHNFLKNLLGQVRTPSAGAGFFHSDLFGNDDFAIAQLKKYAKVKVILENK